MQSNNFFPRTTRNRIAMLMGMASLISLITWNLMPNYIFIDYFPFGRWLWSECLEETLSIHQAINGLSDTLSKIAFILLPLLLILTLTLIPAWKIWQSSGLLRSIAAILMLVGLVICIVYMIFYQDSFYLHQVRFVAFNFLTTMIALLLFKNESLDLPHAI